MMCIRWYVMNVCALRSNNIQCVMCMLGGELNVLIVVGGNIHAVVLRIQSDVYSVGGHVKLLNRFMHYLLCECVIDCTSHGQSHIFTRAHKPVNCMLNCAARKRTRSRVLRCPNAIAHMQVRGLLSECAHFNVESDRHVYVMCVLNQF